MEPLERDPQLLFGGESPRVLRETAKSLFLYKPPGMSVFASRQFPDRPCLYDFLLQERPQAKEQLWPVGFEGGILHRLDVATSGLIWVAKNLMAFEEARGAFREKRLEKYYLFLSASPVPWSQQLVSNNIAHHSKNRRKMVVQIGPRSAHRGQWMAAQTHFTYLKATPEMGAHLYRAQISTGVMHQIRVHAKQAGCPLLGDKLYGGEQCPGPSAEAAFFLHHQRMEKQGTSLCECKLPALWTGVSGT